MIKTANGNWLVLARVDQTSANDGGKADLDMVLPRECAARPRIRDPVMASVIIGGAIVARMCRVGH